MDTKDNQTPPYPRLKNKLGLISIASVIGLVACKWLYDLARAPSQPKPCLFTFPANADKPTTLAIAPPEWLTHRGGFMNDASCLNRTPVYGIVAVKNEADVKNALQFARDNHIQVTAAGQRHSMGGQSFRRNGLVLDMRSLNAITIDADKKIARVQSGATWEDVQKTIDPLGLSVKAMQSINIFTIGGTLSVNAHGIAHNPGPIASTVRSLRVMLPSGAVVFASPTENVDLFKHVLGGYGLFGIILEAELDLVDNEVYTWKTNYLTYTDFPTYFKEHIAHNPDVGLFFARLSPSPFGYLQETAVHTFEKTGATGSVPRLLPTKSAWLERLIFNFSKTGAVGRSFRWTIEKYAAKKVAPCVPRNEALLDRDECLLARNQAMYDAMPYLKNKLADTDILQEYLIPPEAFPAFVDELRTIVQANKVNLLNVTIRYVHRDTITALPYAKQDMFGLVLYFNQHPNQTESAELQMATHQLVDLVNKYHGTHYLSYQLYYSKDQLRQAYPEIDAFFAAKKIVDPEHILTNTWLEAYK